jgi:hypothetical protein
MVSPIHSVWDRLLEFPPVTLPVTVIQTALVQA